MEKNKTPFTQEQQEVISDSGHNLIVSAAAGSGKTTVMIERIARLIEKDRVPISNILVVTFTKASSSDMKTKLIKKLSKLDPDPFILEQIEDVSMADVSTLHSFCAKLLKTYFYEAGLDPTFVVLSEQETATLKQKALSDLFDKKFEAQDLDFYILVDSLQQNRNDKLLKDTILKLYEFFNVILNKDEWFEKGLNELYSTNLKTNFAANLINGYVSRRVEKLREKLAKKINRFADLQVGEYVEFLQKIDSDLLLIKKENSFEVNAANIFEIGKFGYIPKIQKDLEEMYKDEIKETRDEIQKEIGDFKENYISHDVKTLVRELEGAKKLAHAIFDATTQFAGIYADLKKETGGLDYNDLEQYTLKIFENQDILNAVREKYRYVFVDEYQDINNVQEKIISLVSKYDNRFMVGDVKQSIYGFRLCNPDIFLKKYHEYSFGGKNKAVNLSKNFRSNQHILNFINKVFEGKMTKDFGGVDYVKEKLVAGKNFQQENPVTLCYINTAGLAEYKMTYGNVDKSKVYSVCDHNQEEELENLKNMAEAEYIASQINDLVANQTITVDEDNNKRSIKFRDIAILIPARNEFLITLLQIFENHKIPYSTDMQINLLEDKYVKCMFNFLKLLYDHKQDIELFSVLNSPMTDLSLNDIANLRKVESDCKFFYQSIENIIKNKQINANLLEKLQKYVEKFKYYKNLSKFKTIKQLAKIVAQDFEFENMILCEINGKQRVVLFEKFVESLPEQTLSSYFVDGNNTELFAENSANTNAVQIVTIHKSKGLEYPVTFVADASKSFNFQDLRANTLISKKHGVAMDYFDTESRYKNKTIAREAIKIDETNSLIEEEQRLLYVALTRAINKLYVVVSKNLDEIRSEFVERKKNFSNWFDPIMSEYLETGRAVGYLPQVIDAEDYLNLGTEQKTRKVVFGGKDNKFIKLIEDNINFAYRDEKQTQKPLKTSVTEIASGYHESEEVYQKYNIAITTSSVEKGNAYHKFMQYISFEFKTLTELEEYGKNLVNSGRISQRELELVNKNAILKLLQSQDFKDIVCGKTLREQEFFMNISDNLDVQILQGVIDLAIIKPNGTAIIVDYKTGNFSGKENANKYTNQISIYAKAFEKAFDKKVEAKYIVGVEQAAIIKV